MAQEHINQISLDKLSIHGELSFLTAENFYQQGRRLIKSKSSFVIDLSDVSRSDSAGLALLLAWISEAKRFNCQLRLTHLPQQLVNLAKVIGIAHLLEANSL